MSKIAVLLPRQTILEYARKVIQEKNLDIPILKVVDNESAVLEAEKAKAAGCQIVIARGLQAQMIKDHTDIPVVEMTISTQEIGLMIRKAKQYLRMECPTIAIIAFKNQFANMEYMEELFGFRLRLYMMQELEDAEKIIRLAISEGADLVIGGVNVTQKALEIGVPCQFIETREDSIRYALDIALKMDDIMAAKQHGDIQLETIFDASFNGIVKINAYREIVAVNRVIENFLGKTAQEVVGFPIEKIFPDIDVESISSMLGKTDEIYSSACSVRDNLMMIMGAPIQYDGDYIGAILTFHRVKKAEKANLEHTYEKKSGSCIARYHFDDILRKSNSIRECVEKGKIYALSKSPVLIQGESGTEKVILAESIHNNSEWSKGSFYNIDCASMNTEEQKKVLFGDKKEGILTHGLKGTVLLQDIDALSMECQKILCHVIKNKESWINGILVYSNIQVRFIATTSQNLWELLKKGVICEELGYLFAGDMIKIPSLRETKDDIEELVRVYTGQYENRYSRYVEISTEAMKLIKGYYWRGNLPQLKGFCEYLVLAVRKRKIDEGIVKNLLESMYPLDEKEAIGGGMWKDPQAIVLEELLEKYKGNKNAVAEELGISPTTVWRKMKKFGIIYQK